MDTDETREPVLDKALVNKLLKKLTNNFYDEVKCMCDVAGYHLTDLLPKTKENFQEKGSPSEIENIRFLHHEENRIAKIMKIAGDIAGNPENTLFKSQSTINLMKQLGIHTLTNRKTSRTTSLCGNDNYKSFHKPQDLIQYNYEKEKEKYHKSLHMIEKISNIKEEAQRKVEQKLKMFAEREKKLMAEKHKKDEEHEKHTQMQVEKRKQILNKKYQIEESINRQCLDIGELLEQRMMLLTEREKKILREKMIKQREKIKTRINNDFQRIVMDEMKIKEEEKTVEVMIKELQKKIESRVHQYECNVKKKVQTAKNHSEKVEHKFNQNLKDESAKQEEKLKKVVFKSQLCEEKKDKKTTLAKGEADRLKNEIEKCFDRHSKGIKEVDYAEIKRLEDIEQRDLDKRKTFSVIKDQIQNIYKEKKYQNSTKERNHSAKYNVTQENYVIII